MHDNWVSQKSGFEVVRSRLSGNLQGTGEQSTCFKHNTMQNPSMFSIGSLCFSLHIQKSLVAPKNKAGSYVQKVGVIF